jgi:hypothetical protein
VSEHGIAPERVDVVLNAVDLRRFPRRAPLPARPARALIFSNSSGERGAHVKAIRDACARTGIRVEIAGFKSGKTLERPEETLAAYDIVFAKARAALEAAAVGTAVILCDVAGAGPMVTTANVAALRRLNFGMRALRETATADGIAREIARYDGADAAAVSKHVREEAGLEAQVYVDVLAETRAGEADVEAEMRAAAAFLRGLSPKLYERDLLRMAFAQLLRLPFVGTLMRRRARREASGHWFQNLLRALDRD